MTIAISGTTGITLTGQFDSASTFGFRNRIINGAMVIDQRNAGASGTASVFTVDRWSYPASQASKGTWQQNAGSVTTPVGFKNYLGFTSSSAYSVLAGDYFLFRQPIEGFNTADLGFGTANASTVTLSFWVRSSLTGTFGVVLSSGNASRGYPATYTISSANTWEYKTITVAGDTSGTWVGATNAAGMLVDFGLGVGSTYSATANAWSSGNILGATGATSVVGTNGATFYITGVQLEKGSTATSFDYRPYGTELALCQRYFRYAGGSAGRATSTTASEGIQLLSPQMRTTPTLTLVSGTKAILEPGIAYRDITGVSVAGDQNNNNAIGIGTSGSTSMTTGNVISIAGNNGISLSAEL